MKPIYFAIVGLVILGGCKSSRHIENAAISQTVAVNKASDTIVVRDTFKVKEYARDSVVVERRGDTVYVDRWHERKRLAAVKTELARVSIARDTVVRTDTVVRMVKDGRKERRSGPTWLPVAVGMAIAAGGAVIVMKRM